MSPRDLTPAAAAVRARRGDLGWSQERLAEEAKVALRTVTNLETGKRWPIAANQAKIESALGWSSGDLARTLQGYRPKVADEGGLPAGVEEILAVDPELREKFMQASPRRQARLVALYREAQQELEEARRRSDDKFRQMVEDFATDDHPAAD